MVADLKLCTTYIVIAFSSRCLFVVLSLAAKRRVVMRRVVAMSPCRLANKPILRFEPSDNVNRDNMPHENALFWVHGY
jgi:hypothetical protein